MKFKSCFAALFFLAGCAASIMEGYVGQDLSVVVAERGPPFEAFDLPDGRRAFQWRVDSAYYVPQTTTATVYGSGNYATGTATTYGGYGGSKTCFYTLYGQKNAGDGYTVVGYQPPVPGCR